MAKGKTKAELQANFKRSNMSRRQKIAEAAGFATIDEYWASIQYAGKSVPLSARKARAKKIIDPIDSPRISEEDDSVPVDMVICFDTTGSMGSYIKAVREHIKMVIKELFEKTSDLRVGIVAHGDYCDIRGIKDQNLLNGDIPGAYFSISPTNVPDALIRFINKNHSTAGGDPPEFYELVIKKINEETPWRSNAKKAVLMIADANPHHVGYSYGRYKNQINWLDEAKNAAKLGIQYDTLSCGGAYSGWRIQLSEMTGGVHLPFQKAKNTQHVVVGSTLARASKKAFVTYSGKKEVTSDAELSASYSALKKKFID